MRMILMLIFISLLSGCSVIPRTDGFTGEEVRITIIDTKTVEGDPQCSCHTGNCYSSTVITIVQDENGRSDKWCGWYGPVGYQFNGIYLTGLTQQLHMK